MLADYRDNACLSHEGYSFDRSIDITQILKLQKENHLLMNLLGKTLGKSVIDKNINHSLL
jgi:DNA-directed RNA polymerase subunit L